MTVVAIIGKSCSGKSTLADELVRRGFATVVSHTTRGARPGEINGRDYHFVSMDEFADLDANDGFIETNYFSENWYGKSIGSMVTACGRARHVVAIVEPHGATCMRRYCKETGQPFIAAWVNVLEQDQVERLAARNRKLSPQDVQARLNAINDVERFWPPNSLELDMVLNSSSFSPKTLADFIAYRLGEPEVKKTHTVFDLTS